MPIFVPKIKLNPANNRDNIWNGMTGSNTWSRNGIDISDGQLSLL